MSYRTRIAAHPDGYTGLDKAEATLPKRWYVDPGQYARELSRIWYRHWLYVCRADALPEPGSFKTYELGDQNILLVKDRHGEIRAFHNTCRHRGSRIVNEPEGRLGALALTCPYHAWVYKLDGRLFKTPNLLDDGGLDKAQYGLFPVPLKNWRGFLFLCLAENPPPFEEMFDGGDKTLANWPLEDLVVGHRATHRVACNWKLFWENFNECYHCPGVHPSLVKLMPIYGRGISGVQDDPKWKDNAQVQDPKFRGGVRSDAGTWSVDGHVQGPGFPNLSEYERKRGVVFMTLLPTGYWVGHPDYVRVVRIKPAGALATELQIEWLFARETLELPGFDLQKIVQFGLTVIQEDGHACEINQLGMNALPFDTGVLLPQEYSVKDFQDWVRKQLAE